MTNYILVRHGTTEWVDTQRLHGITDIPLNQKGRDQASAAAKALADYGADRVVASPLSRAAETAQIIGRATSIKPELMDALAEINFGWLEGTKIRDHDRGKHSRWVEFLDHQYFTLIRALSGDSKSQFAKRVLAGWRAIGEENHSDKVILVAHSGVLDAILTHLFGTQFLNGNAYHHINPCSITEFLIRSDGSAEMVRLNDRSHLPPDLQ